MTPSNKWAKVAEDVNPNLGEINLRGRSVAKRDLVAESAERSANPENTRSRKNKMGNGPLEYLFILLALILGAIAGYIAWVQMMETDHHSSDHVEEPHHDM